MTYMIVNRDDQPERWDTAAAHIRSLGVEPVRFPAYSSPNKTQAICRTYYLLLSTLTVPAVVAQDDVFPTGIPTVDGFTVHNKPSSERHICPKLFTVTPDLAPVLAERFNMANRACRLMPRLVAEYGELGEVLV